MKSIKFILCVLALAVFLPGCSSPQRQPQVVIVTPAPIDYKEIALTEGVTTKKEILEILGPPDSVSQNSITYKYYEKHRATDGLKGTHTQKDGTVFMMTFDRNTGGYVLMFFDDKSILSSLSY